VKSVQYKATGTGMSSPFKGYLEAASKGGENKQAVADPQYAANEETKDNLEFHAVIRSHKFSKYYDGDLRPKTTSSRYHQKIGTFEQPEGQREAIDRNHLLASYEFRQVIDLTEDDDGAPLDNMQHYDDDERIGQKVPDSARDPKVSNVTNFSPGKVSGTGYKPGDQLTDKIELLQPPVVAVKGSTFHTADGTMVVDSAQPIVPNVAAFKDFKLQDSKFAKKLDQHPGTISAENQWQAQVLAMQRSNQPALVQGQMTFGPTGSLPPVPQKSNPTNAEK
jgi:hypothetical protein